MWVVVEAPVSLPAMTLPPVAVLKHIGDRLKANDIAWFKSRFAAGEFAWLRDHLPEGGYTKLGERIEEGDLAYVRRLLAGLDLPGFGAAAGGARGGAAGAAIGGTGKVAAIGTVMGQDDRRKKGGIWLLPIALIAALGLGFWLTHLGKDDPSDMATADTTVAVAEESVAPPTEPAETDAAAAPVTNILETAKAAGSFTTLSAAVDAAGLADTLNGEGPFTVFAPTDDAFAALPAGALEALLKPENKDALVKILTYHVVPGTVLAADIKAGDIATVEGGTVKLATEGGVTVNDAKVLTADVAASNGVIHVIDKVLIPSSVDVGALLAAPTTTAASTPATTTTTTAPPGAPVTRTAPAATTAPPAAPAAPAAAAAASANTIVDLVAADAPVDLTTTNKAGDATPEDLTVYFDSDSAQINAAGQAKIDGAVKILAAVRAGTKVALVGRADKTGDAAANLALSKRRSAAVEAALVKGLGGKASQVKFAAYAKGDVEQIDDLAFARRVTIEIAK